MQPTGNRLQDGLADIGPGKRWSAAAERAEADAEKSNARRVAAAKSRLERWASELASVSPEEFAELTRRHSSPSLYRSVSSDLPRLVIILMALQETPEDQVSAACPSLAPSERFDGALERKRSRPPIRCRAHAGRVVVHRTAAALAPRDSPMKPANRKRWSFPVAELAVHMTDAARTDADLHDALLALYLALPARGKRKRRGLNADPLVTSMRSRIAVSASWALLWVLSQTRRKPEERDPRFALAVEASGRPLLWSEDRLALVAFLVQIVFGRECWNAAALKNPLRPARLVRPRGDRQRNRDGCAEPLQTFRRFLEATFRDVRRAVDKGVERRRTRASSEGSPRPHRPFPDAAPLRTILLRLTKPFEVAAAKAMERN